MNPLVIRQQIIKSLQGKYDRAPTSSEDFAQQKQAEIDWEDRNRKTNSRIE